MSNPNENSLRDDSAANEVAISLDHVSMVFNMASERIQNLKEYFIKLVKRELMFKEFVAVNDVSLAIAKGDVFGLVGSNGSGKSTLLKIIAGVLEPSKGTCVAEGSIAPLIELGAGFDMELSARENIYLNGALLGHSKEFMEAHFDSIVEFAEIENFLEMPMKNYSSGMVARIAFAIATETTPDILIVDEVLSVGDYMFQEKCEKRISALIENHDVTVLIVSHDNFLIERLCNKAAWIEKGNLKLVGDAKTVCNAYKLLGWHIGSSDSEEKLIRLLCDKGSEGDELVETIYAENPYLTSIAVWDETQGAHSADKVVLAPSDDPALCMLANSLSSRLDASLLLIEPDKLSDTVVSILKRMDLKEVFLVEDRGSVMGKVQQRLEELFEGVQVKRVSGENAEGASLDALSVGGIESKKVVIAYPDCIGDILLIMPYLYKHRLPLVFHEPNTPMGSGLVEALRGHDFEEIVLLGGEDVFPEDAISPLAGLSIPITRICGKGAIDATHIIFDWMKGNDPELFEDCNEVFFASLWNMADALSIGRLCNLGKALILLEDSNDVDNVVGNIDIINALPKRPNRLVFFGNEDEFGDVDKKVISKAIQTE